MSAPIADTRSRRALYAGILALLCIAVLALAYLVSVWVRGAGLYLQAKQGALAGGRNGYVGNLLQYDPELGYTGRPNAVGDWLIALGDPVPAYHGADGLRTPAQGHPAAGDERRPRLLFLGDSFTYGQLVAAEDSFAFGTAARLGGKTINAGVPGYNLAQMSLKARQLVPKYKPDYVVVQYTPWLVGRAVSEFAPSVYPTHIAVPYYSDSGAGLEIQPPAFSPAFFSLPDAYRKSAPGLADRFSFFAEVALPAFLWDDTHMAWLRARQLLGLARKPSSDYEAVVSKAYGDIDAVARENGARLIIVAMGMGEEMQVPGHLFPRNIYGVNAHNALMAGLQEKTPENYMRQYWLWRGNPPQPVDAHPNERAHAIIAEAIAERVRRGDRPPQNIR